MELSALATALGDLQKEAMRAQQVALVAKGTLHMAAAAMREQIEQCLRHDLENDGFEGLSPQAIVERYASLIVSSLKAMSQDYGKQADIRTGEIASLNKQIELIEAP